MRPVLVKSTRFKSSGDTVGAAVVVIYGNADRFTLHKYTNTDRDIFE